jgi:hypothetical protein
MHGLFVVLEFIIYMYSNRAFSFDTIQPIDLALLLNYTARMCCAHTYIAGEALARGVQEPAAGASAFFITLTILMIDLR